MIASLSVPGASEWLALADELQAGIAHALNNRITSLGVCAELAAMGDEEMLAQGVLVSEVARLQEVARQLGLLCARGPAEALEVRPVLEDAVAIHALHPRMCMQECRIEHEGEPQPVRTPRWALLRALLVLVDGAKNASEPGGRTPVVVRLAYDAEQVRVEAPTAAGDGAYAREMAAVCGATLTRDDERLAFALPSLAALRRHEHMGRAPG